MLQQPLFKPKSSWTPPTEFPDFIGRGAKEIVIDTETKDPNLMAKGPGFIRGDAHIAGVSIMVEDYCAYYPVRHEGGGNLAPNIVFSWLKTQLETEGVLKIGANLLYECEGLMKEGIHMQGPFFDVQIAEPLIDEHRFSYNLESLAQKYLGKGKEEALLRDAASAYKIDPKGELYKLPAAYVGAYAEGDVLLPKAIKEEQEKILTREDLWDIFNLESELMPIILEMKWRGVKVDLDAAERLSKEFFKKEQFHQKQLNDLVGFHVDVWSSKKLPMAYRLYGIRNLPTTKTGRPSITADWLAEQGDPVSQHARIIRKYSTMRSNFIDGDILQENVKGRIHAEFHQLRQTDKGVRHGRMSSCNPNLQQFPSRDEEFAAPMRGVFIPDEGFNWTKGDYAQQEPVVGLHYAIAAHLPGAAKMKEEYIARFAKGEMDFHQMTADIAGMPDKRKKCKAINLGTMYGAGLEKLALMLEMSLENARSFRTEYFNAIPYMTSLIRLCSKKAEERGFIRTILGRKLHFPFWEPADLQRGERVRPLEREEALQVYNNRPLRRAMLHKAINRLIQGSSADMLKQAVIKIRKNLGIIPYLLVHDEWDGPGRNYEESKLIKREMEQAVALHIPIRSDTAVGLDWGHCTKI